MDLDWMFTLELLLMVVLLVGFASGAIYLWVKGRGQGEGAPKREDAPGKRASAQAGTASREFFKRLSLETGEEMRARLYPIAEYESQLGGEPSALGSGDFVAALKAYRCLDDEWYDYSPEKAADVLELEPEDYEVDEEHKALLLKRLPPGTPTAVRDVL